MRSEHLIEHGDEEMSLALTVKEVMALCEPVHFYGDRHILAGARNKLRHSLERKLLTEESYIQDQKAEILQIHQ